MPRIFITSGTSYTLPADFNPDINTVECYGSGEDGAVGVAGGGVGGGGGAYAKVTNCNVEAGVTVNIHIGSAGALNTWFNATSLANAVSNGTSISCGAAGAIGQAGGLASSSCGTVKYNGGSGGGANNYGGGGGGGAGGPNGAGANGGSGGTTGTNFGGGGGGANSGSVGQSPPSSNYAGWGGNNRFGGGGGWPGSSPSPGPTSGGNGSSGGGGGGGGYGTGGAGSLDDVYSTAWYGPYSGGGGGSTASHSFVWGGGNAGQFGGGGGGGGALYGAAGQSGIGLIVITYTPLQISPKAEASTAFLAARPPVIYPIPKIKQRLDGLTPPQNLSWMRQPLDRIVAPGRVRLWRFSNAVAQPWQNQTPLYKNPWETPPDILRKPPTKTLDTRQQFPGKAPMDFHATLIEGADSVTTFSVDVTSPINAALIQGDTVTSFIDPTPVKGGADDMIRRVKLTIPTGWFNFAAPFRDAIIGGIADVASWAYSLVTYAKLQSRVAWATGIWLDIISKDYFGLFFPRKTNESDDRFRARIQKELLRERVTRKGMTDALTDLTGLKPVIFEPWNPGDTGAWDVGNFALDKAGGWGDTILPAQAFINTQPPGAGIPGAPGWDIPALGWDVAGMWGDMSLIAGTITDQDVYDTINRTRPTGSIMWTQLFKPVGPTPVPQPKTRTPTFAPPGMISPVVRPGPQRYSMSLIPPLGGPKSRVL